MKIVILILYFSSFVYFVVLEGVDEYLRAETNYINSEIQSYKQANNFKEHEYVSREFVEDLTKKYRASFDKKTTIINNQISNSKIFSVVILLLSFVFIVYLSTNYLYLLAFLLPSIHATNQLYKSSGFLSYQFLVYPLLAVVVMVAFKYIYNKRRKSA